MLDPRIVFVCVGVEMPADRAYTLSEDSLRRSARKEGARSVVDAPRSQASQAKKTRRRRSGQEPGKEEDQGKKKTRERTRRGEEARRSDKRQKPSPKGQESQGQERVEKLDQAKRADAGPRHRQGRGHAKETSSRNRSAERALSPNRTSAKASERSKQIAEGRPRSRSSLRRRFRVSNVGASGLASRGTRQFPRKWRDPAFSLRSAAPSP